LGQVVIDGTVSVEYNLTINPNGGTYNGTTGNTVVPVAYKKKSHTFKHPVRDNYLFSHWTSSTSNDFYTSGNYAVYNNNGNGTVTISWDRTVLSPGVCVLKVVTNGSASPGAGGFYQSVGSEANHVYYQVYRAKIPVGYTFK
jgi:hypothetical protein